MTDRDHTGLSQPAEPPSQPGGEEDVAHLLRRCLNDRQVLLRGLVVGEAIAERPQPEPRQRKGRRG